MGGMVPGKPKKKSLVIGNLLGGLVFHLKKLSPRFFPVTLLGTLSDLFRG